MKKNYLFLLITTIAFSTAFGQIQGTWKLAPQEAALAVGPSKGASDWWKNSAEDVDTRACLFDDQYKFNADGSFENVMGDATWLEGWQGVDEGCGTPVAPHDGSAIATWSWDADKMEVTLTGTGAYIGLAKVHNSGELASPADAVASITYPVEFSADGKTMTIDINFGGGWWRYVLAKEEEKVEVDLGGTSWKLAPQEAALAVGPEKGNSDWWKNSAEDVDTRACLFDDEYKFNADGSFENVLGDETWLEGWQGVDEGCGTPVAPHDGSAIATWSWDADKMEVTLTGTGAYLGLAKVHNSGELASPADAVASITYPVEMSADGETMTIDINFGGGWWRYVFAKQEDNSSVKTIDKNLFKVYPNPANNEITVSSDENLAKVTIYDVTGKVMYTSNDVNANSTVNVSTFSRGIYMVEVMTDNKVSVKRLILE
jgi:hypothetical protein